MIELQEMDESGAFDKMPKKEAAGKRRELGKLKRSFSGIADMKKLPAAIFVVDIRREDIAVREANRLNIPVVAMVDTNSNPKAVDFPIPANDDATKSISIVLDEICGAIKEGLEERKTAKNDDGEKEEKKAVKKAEVAEEATTEEPAAEQEENTAE